MTTSSEDERFTFDLERIAPDWPSPEQREAAWLRVFTHFYPRLREYFVLATHDSDIAEDVVSEVFRRALLRLHEIGSPHAAWSWLRTTGANYLLDMQRHEQVELRRAEAIASENALPVEATLDDVVARVAAMQDVDDDPNALIAGRVRISRGTWEERLAQLSTLDRQLLELVELHGYTHPRAADELGLPSAAASRKRHSRIRRFLATGTRAE